MGSPQAAACLLAAFDTSIISRSQTGKMLTNFILVVLLPFPLACFSLMLLYTLLGCPVLAVVFLPLALQGKVTQSPGSWTSFSHPGHRSQTKGIPDPRLRKNIINNNNNITTNFRRSPSGFDSCNMAL